MRSIDTIIIGGGQAGLAMSHCLSDRGIEHVILERGRVGERWRSERWDSLRMLTPRWQSRLPGWSYEGPDPDGYMTRGELVDYLERYATSFTAPLESGVTVKSVEPNEIGYRVHTDQGSWRARSVVIATGDCGHASVPSFSQRLSRDVFQIAPTRYKNPEQLPPDGGVLVVGASATGVQLASEIHASGRAVTLSVGRHTRLPRTYRGRDILWWLDDMGVFDERAEEVRNLTVSRGQPSLQLVGTPDQRTLDLSTLVDSGIRLLGRARAAEGHRIAFSDDLIENTVAADAKLAGLLSRIDRHIESTGLSDQVSQADYLRSTPLLDAPTSLDLKASGISTVLWATGYRRSYPWLHLPVLDEHGEIRHESGVTPLRGLYVMGLQFMRRRKSSFIDGVGQDAEELAEHMMAQRRASLTAAA